MGIPVAASQFVLNMRTCLFVVNITLDASVGPSWAETSLPLEIESPVTSKGVPGVALQHNGELQKFAFTATATPYVLRKPLVVSPRVSKPQLVQGGSVNICTSGSCKSIRRALTSK